MASEYGIKLATHLVSDNWGVQRSKVFECLLRRGTLTLAQIIRFTELSRETVRQSLIVLIHQNCVQAFAIQREGGFGEPPKVITEYMALFDNAIHLMRFPKFIQIVKEEVGEECEEIFEGLVQHGRLSLSEIIDRHKQTSSQGNCKPAEDVKKIFNKLVNARFVERCPAPEPYLEPPSEDEPPAKKRGAKTPKAREVPETTEQRALAAAAPLESLRFLVEMDNLNDVSERTTDENLSYARVGEKRKQNSLESDGGLLSTYDNKKEVLWRINFEEFMRCLRHKACIANVRSRINDEAGIVLSAILELSRRSETKVKSESTASLSLDDIYDEVIKKEGGIGMNLERVRASLVQLGCEIPTIQIDETYSIASLVRLGCEMSMKQIDETYNIDLKNIIEMAQTEEVESIVLKRYGKEAHRLFRLLSKTGRLLETDKIADMTFVEKKDAIRILYKLWKDDYLQMEKVTVSGARQTVFSLWKVNKEALRKLVLDEMYHAALNLRIRILHEQEQDKEILQVPSDKLEGELHKKYLRYKKVRIILESCFANLDDALMLFHIF